MLPLLKTYLNPSVAGAADVFGECDADTVPEVDSDVVVDTVGGIDTCEFETEEPSMVVELGHYTFAEITPGDPRVSNQCTMANGLRRVIDIDFEVDVEVTAENMNGESDSVQMRAEKSEHVEMEHQKRASGIAIAAH